MVRDPDADDPDPASELTKRDDPSWNSLINHEVVQEYETYIARNGLRRTGHLASGRGREAPITPAQWAATATTTPPDESVACASTTFSRRTDSPGRRGRCAVRPGGRGHVELIGAYQGARTRVAQPPIDCRPATTDRGDCHSWARRVGRPPKRCVNAGPQAHIWHHEAMSISGQRRCSSMRCVKAPDATRRGERRPPP